MNKPNITEGKWVIDRFSSGTVSVLYKHDGWADIVADINTKCTSGHCEANAKAISAVPEMIDALIDCMRTLEDNHLADTFAYEKTLQALEKAGVEL